MLALSVQLGTGCGMSILWFVCSVGAWGLVLGGLWGFGPSSTPSFSKQLGGNGLVAATHRVVMDTLCVRLGFIRGLTLLSRHHSPSLFIVDEFKCG